MPFFHSSCAISHLHQQCTSVPISPHPQQHLLFSGFLIIPIPVGVRQYCLFLRSNKEAHEAGSRVRQEQQGVR